MTVMHARMNAAEFVPVARANMRVESSKDRLGLMCCHGQSTDNFNFQVTSDTP